MTAKQIVQALKQESWINEICRKEYPFISKMKTAPQFSNHTELTVRIPTEQKTRFGKPKPQRRRFDVVSLVKPWYAAYGDDILTVGVEIKVSKSDLMNDKKLIEYLAYTDYFFICVPYTLLSDAMTKIMRYNECIREHIGIIWIKGVPIAMEGFEGAQPSAEIYRMPNRQKCSKADKLKVFRELSLRMLKV